MYRRDLLKQTGATAATIAAPAFIGPITLGSSETLTKLATANGTQIQSYGDGNPSFVIPYETDSDRADLKEWTTSQDGGRIIRDLETVGMLVVSVPWEAAGRQTRFGLRHWSGGFDDLEYVTYADANTIRSLPAPIKTLASPSDVGHDFTLREQAGMAIQGGSKSEMSGLAFDEDAPEATLRQARNLVRAGDDFLAGIDTSSTVASVIDTGANDYTIYEDSSGTLRFLDASTDFTASGDPTVGEDGPSAIYDGNSHGSWVLGCIASSDSDDANAGFGQAADLAVAKSLGDDGSGETADIVAGIELAIEQSADVACLSLGSPQWSESIADALEEAWKAGVFCVVAVGNDRYATTFVACPASSERGFGVNATNVPESGNRDDTKIAYFGNVGPHPGNFDFSSGDSRGATPKLAAPGMSIRVDPPGVKSGTSMAAPMVAGGALVLAAEGYTNEEIWDRLTSCAYPIPNAGVTETEYGLLDVKAAVNGKEYDKSQKEVRNDDAVARDNWNRAYAETRGRTLGGLFA